MKTRRILSTLLALVIVLSSFTFVGVTASADEVTAVYVKQDATGDGLSEGSPTGSINVAVSKLTGDGTVYIIGSYTLASGNSYLPESSYEITYEGLGSGADLRTTGTTDGIILGSPTVFRNIHIYDRDNGHLNTMGYKVTFSDGVTFRSGVIAHLGPLMTVKGNVASQHVVFDGSVPGSKHFGGGYSRGNHNGIDGDYIIEVRKGNLDNITFFQDCGEGWLYAFYSVKIGGNVKIVVDDGASVGSVVNSNENGWQFAKVGGYFHVLLRGNATIGNVDVSNSASDKYFSVKVPDITNGTVDFAEETGLIQVAPAPGYIAKMTTGDDVTYGSAGKYPLTLGKTTVVEFTNEITLGASLVDFRFELADPENGVWNGFSITNDEYNLDVTIDGVEDQTTEVPDYYTQYVYNVTISPKTNIVFPFGFDFTINGEEEYDKSSNPGGYKITNFVSRNDGISFKYRAERTAFEATKRYLMFSGGAAYIVNSLTPPPEKLSFEKSDTTATIGAEALSYYTKRGYKLIGYTDGENEYTSFPATVSLNEELTTLEAVWEALPTVAVRYSGGMASNGREPKVEAGLLAGDTVVLPECTFSLVASEFVAWEYNGTEYAPGNIFTITQEMIDAGNDVVFTAKFVASAGCQYYVQTKNGHYKNDGSKDAPFNTIETAIKKAEENGESSVIILVDGTISLNKLPETQISVTITGIDNNSVIKVPSELTFLSDTTIRDITLEAVDTSTVTTFYTNGKKSVFGPNINGEFDIVDGAKERSVTSIDTTIRTDVNNYYFAGESGGLNGNSLVRVEGNPTINRFELSGKGTNTFSASNVSAFILDARNITISVSDRMPSGNKYFIFTEGSKSNQDDFITSKLSSSKRNVFILDANSGGKVDFENKKISATYNGKITYVKAARNPSAVIENNTLQPQQLANYSNGINTLSFGECIDSTKTIEIVMINPVAGASTSNVSPSIDPSGEVNVIAKVADWGGPLSGDKKTYFKYDTIYKPTLTISPANGYYFDKLSVVNVNINGTPVTGATLTGGTLSVKYEGFEMTASSADAPSITVNFDSGIAVGGSVSGTINPSETCTQLEYQYLPAPDVKFLGYYFTGWQSDISINGKTLHKAGTSVRMDVEETEVTFTAMWELVGSWDLPCVLLMYDLTATSSNGPKFPSGSDKKLITDGFNLLNEPLNGAYSTNMQSFEFQNYVTLESDGGDLPFVFNHYTLQEYKMDPTEYKYVTLVYYYDTEDAAAEGEHGIVTFGNTVPVGGGEASKWMNYQVESEQEIVANEWAYMTFDISGAIDKFGIEEGKNYIRQCHFYPFGMHPNKEFEGDKVYFDKMYFSKLPPNEK